MDYYNEPAKRIPAQECDVVVVGGGTAGVIAAIAAARQGARTVLIESKGYPGGVAVEGGTALHSFYNLWKAFPNVEKRQVVRGIPAELVDRLVQRGGSCGYPEMERGYDYDSVCTVIDTELYKLVAFEMLEEAGVRLCMNTFAAGAVMENAWVRAVLLESRNGREAFFAHAFIDCTGYGDLSAHAGAAFCEPNDHPVANSIGVAGVNIEQYAAFLEKHGALRQFCRGRRSRKDGMIVRVDGGKGMLPEEFLRESARIGMSNVITTIHDDYFMFLKLNLKLSVSPTDRDAVSKAEVELRRRQEAAVALFRRFVPGCEKAYMTRSSPSLCIRRGRCIVCDYDITLQDVLEGRHFADDVLAYGFHDCAPRLQVKNGGTYGIPYRALRVAGLENLLAAGMLITSNYEAHMSTRNTVCCMGQGQAAGTAAALCATANCATRALDYQALRHALRNAGVYVEENPQAI